MYLVPQTSPLSDLSKRPGDVLSMMDNGPILLLSRSTPAGLLIRPDHWNRIIQRMELLEDLHEARRVLSDDIPTVSGEEMQERMAKHGVGLED